MNQMLSLESESSSAESSTTANQSSRIRKKQMGMWLSLLPPGTHGCSLCNKSFRSLQAVGGHQNAHRKLRIQIQMQKMYRKILEKEEKRRRIREGKRKKNSCNSTGAPVASDHDGEGEIDLDLRLGCGPKKVMDMHEFMPVKRVKGHGVGGAHSGSGVNYKANSRTQSRNMSPAAYGQSLLFPELPENPLRAGVNEGGVGVGVGGDEPGADQCAGLLCGGRNTMKVAAKTELDLTLKL